MVHKFNIRQANFMTDLTIFEFNVDGETFRKLFVDVGGAEDMADHIWGKFHEYDHSILKLWAHLDNDNRIIVNRVITRWLDERKKKYPKEWWF